jgi:hypothetical protein
MTDRRGQVSSWNRECGRERLTTPNPIAAVDRNWPAVVTHRDVTWKRTSIE